MLSTSNPLRFKKRFHKQSEEHQGQKLTLSSPTTQTTEEGCDAIRKSAAYRAECSTLTQGFSTTGPRIGSGPQSIGQRTTEI